MRKMVVVSALALAAAVAPPVTAEAATAPAVISPAATVGDPAPIPSLNAPPGENGELIQTFVETVKYGKHRRQKMDVWWQESTQRRPGVFIIHGGWWSQGDKTGIEGIAHEYATLGYAVFNINYRLSGDAAWPAQRIDALSAIAAARRNAARWSFDPDNYVVIGFSAGGHIATAVGTYKNGRPGLKGVVGMSPVISPLTAYDDGKNSPNPRKRRLRKAAITLAGGCKPKGGCARVWASMEVPWHASRGDAPMLTFHSEDEFVPPSHSELLQEQLRRVGVEMTVRTVPGNAHSTGLYRIPEVAESVQRWIAEKLGQASSTSSTALL